MNGIESENEATQAIFPQTQMQEAKGSFKPKQSIKQQKRDNTSPKQISALAIKSAASCMLTIAWSQFAIANEMPGTTTIDGRKSKTIYLNGGETLVVAPSGSIAVSPKIKTVYSPNSGKHSVSTTTTGENGLGIFATGSSNSIINSGLISTTALSGFGIFSNGSSNAITNSGSISTTALSGFSIFSNGSSNAITNSGSISTTALSGFGILSNGSSNAITNSGLISTTALSGFVIFSNGSSNAITNSGSISTTALSGFGIFSNGSSNAITNSGSISTTALSGFSIFSNGSSNAITNSGSISTTALSGFGILSNGSSNTITNSGSISTTALSGFSILSNGSSNAITNSGSISTSGEIGFSILTVGSNNAITNSGSINTTGTLGVGIYSDKDHNSIANSGSISTTGALGFGIHSNGSRNTIANSGSISATGENAIGIYARGDHNSITNSGNILSKKSYAIYFDGLGNTLNILNNYLGGRINMGTEGTVNITTGANYSKLFTFEGTVSSINGSGSVPLFINLSTQQAATYDPTVFASSSDALADMTNAISSMARGRISESDNEHPVWATGFGMTSSYEGSHATQERSYSFSGAVMGYDTKPAKDLTIGILGGYGQTSLTDDGKTTQSFKNTSNDGFMGIYGQKRWKSLAIDFGIYGGLQSFQQQRFVNSNLTQEKNSSANTSYQGWWISTEAGATYIAAEVNGWSLQPTARLRYAQQWMGGHAETGGGPANANINGRSIAIGQSFVGIGTQKTIETNIGKDKKLTLEGQVGYLYRGSVGDDTLGVTIIGQSLWLPIEASSRNAVAVSAGATVDLSSAVTLKIRGDFAAGSGMKYVGSGWAGLSLRF